MAQDLNAWDVLAANNNDVPPDGWPENTMLYSEVNNTGREVQAVLRRFFGDVNGSLVTGGIADAYTLTLNATTYLAYFAGMYFACEINATNTGAATIDVNGIGVQSIVDRNGAALSAGALQSGGIFEFRYDGTNFQLMGSIAGAVSASNAILSSANAIDLVDTDVALNVGAADPDAAQHLEFDPQSIQSKSDINTAANMTLQPVGGDLVIFGATGTFIRGALSNDPTAGGVQDAVIQFANNVGNAAGDVGFVDGNIDQIWYNRVHGGRSVIRGESDAGTVRDVLAIDYSSAGGSIIFSEPNGTQQLMRLDTGVNAVTQKANVLNQPSAGSAQVGLFRVQNRNASPEISMHVGFHESIAQTDLELKNFIHGGIIRIFGEDSLGTENHVFFGDPDLHVGLMFDGFTSFRTQADGIRVTSDTGVDSLLSLEEAGVANTSFTHDVSTDITILRNEINSGHVQIRGRSSAGGDALMASFDPDSTVTLYWDEAQRIRAAQQGPEFIGQGASSVTTRWFQSNGTTLIGTLGFGSSSNSWSGLTDSSDMRIQANDAGSVSRFGFNLDPDNWVQIYHLGLEKWRTRLDGMEVRSADSNNPATPTSQDWQIRMVNASQVLIGSLEFPSSQDMSLVNNVHGGNILIRAENGAGAVTTMIQADPDDDVALFDAGTEVFRTLPAASGGAEANNTLTGGGFERVLTESDTPLVLTAVKGAQTGRNTTTTPAADPDLSIALAIGTWFIEGYIIWNEVTGASQGIQVDFRMGTGTGAGSYNYQDRTSSTNPDTGRAGSNGMTTPLDLVNGDGSVRRAMVQAVVVVSVAGNFEFFWAQSVSNANDTVVFGDSCIVATQLA